MKKKTIISVISVFVLAILLINYLDNQDKNKMLVRHGFKDMEMKEIIESLDKGFAKGTPLQAAITPTHLELSDENNNYRYSYKDEMFYLSFAPYIKDTHPCFNHVPTSCQGELTNKKMSVQVVDYQNNVVFADTVETQDNGFAGIWLPRGIEGVISVSYDNKTSSIPISTSKDAGTCLTKLRLI